MYTRALMTISAAFMALLGLGTLFAPAEVLGMHGTPPDNATMLLIQMMGALYLGFAILNWTARGVLIGGIYSRPVALGNFWHFLIVSLLLIKAAFVFRVLPLAISAAVFSAFATWFGLVMFRPLPARIED